MKVQLQQISISCSQELDYSEISKLKKDIEEKVKEFIKVDFEINFTIKKLVKEAK